MSEKDINQDIYKFLGMSHATEILVLLHATGGEYYSGLQGKRVVAPNGKYRYTKTNPGIIKRVLDTGKELGLIGKENYMYKLTERGETLTGCILRTRALLDPPQYPPEAAKKPVEGVSNE